MCSYFGTCISTGMAVVNARIASIITEAQTLQRLGLCDGLIEAKTEIAAQLTVPLVQGLINYAYRADPARNDPSQQQLWSEAWAFASGLLPPCREAWVSSPDVRESFMGEILFVAAAWWLGSSTFAQSFGNWASSLAFFACIDDCPSMLQTGDRGDVRVNEQHKLPKANDERSPTAIACGC